MVFSPTDGRCQSIQVMFKPAAYRMDSIGAGGLPDGQYRDGPDQMPLRIFLATGYDCADVCGRRAGFRGQCGCGAGNDAAAVRRAFRGISVLQL